MRCPTCERWPDSWEPSRHLTIRVATPAERKHAGDFRATGTPMKAKRYVVVDADKPTVLLGAFGLVDGGNTRAEAVFWAERWASKNGGHFIRPAGWENVVGALRAEREAE